MCQESRSQHANRETCVRRLREMLVLALRPPRRRRRTRPTRSSKESRISEKKNRGVIKAVSMSRHARLNV